MARLPIQRFTTLGDDIAPNFNLSIEGLDAGKGKALFEAVRPLVESVSIEYDEQEATLFELILINQPEEAVVNIGGFGSPVNWHAVLDSKAFQEGNAIDLFMGYAGVHRFMGRTEIVKWMPEFSAFGPTTFTIKGMDARHRMMIGNQFKTGNKIGATVGSGRKREKKRKVFYTESDDLIVKRIAEKYGFGVDTDSVEKRAKGSRVQETGTTDWEFLTRLAQINRMDLSVDYDQAAKKNIIRFKTRQDIGSPIYKFTYNGADGSLIEASPEFQLKDQSTDVEVLVYDRKRKRIERTVISDPVPAENVKLSGAGAGDLEAKREITVGARVRFSAFGQTFEAISDRPFKSRKEAQRFASNYLRDNERELVIMQGRVVGIEDLRPLQVHQIAGLSTRIDGLYRFTNVRHIQAPGQIYSCEFTAHRVLKTDVARRKATSATQDSQLGTQASG